MHNSPYDLKSMNQLHITYEIYFSSQQNSFTSVGGSGEGCPCLHWG